MFGKQKGKSPLASSEGFNYLFGVIDGETKMLLAYKTSKSLEVQFVLDTYEQLKHITFPEEVWPCSDQGTHCTSRAYREKLSLS